MRGGPPAHVTAKKKANKKKKVAKIKTAAPPSEDDLRAAHMALVQDSVARHAPSLLSQLDDNGYAIIDNFLPPATIQQMRAECEGLRTSGKMVASQSTRWDEESGSVSVRAFGIEENLGLETFGIITGEVLRILRVVLIRNGAELVGATVANRPNQFLQIEIG